MDFELYQYIHDVPSSAGLPRQASRQAFVVDPSLTPPLTDDVQGARVLRKQPDLQLCVSKQTPTGLIFSTRRSPHAGAYT